MSKTCYSITLIPGEGIGPEVTDAARRVIEAAGVSLTWELAEAGGEAYRKYGTALPESTLASIRKNHVVLKGPMDTPIGEGYPSVNVGIRRACFLHVNMRPVKSFVGVTSLYSNIDVVIFRQNTEEFYAAEEVESGDGDEVVLTAKITRRGCEKIVSAAFEYARRNGRKKVTLVHKANILKKFYGLFLRVGRKIALEYPDIVFQDMIVDNFAMKLVMNPQQFDVIVLTNLLGDIMSDEAAGLVGGLGLLPSANIGEDASMFEAVHGTAPDIVGKGVANPSAVILSAALMLRHLGEEAAATKIEKAVADVLREGTHVTRDINKEHGVSNREMTDAIIAKIKAV